MKRPPASIESRCDCQAAVLEQLHEIREMLAQLNRGAGPRDDHERRVLEALAARLGDGGSFEALDVIEHGRVNVEFTPLGRGRHPGRRGDGLRAAIREGQRLRRPPA
jgi:hypothetical protein